MSLFAPSLPVVNALRNKGMRDRHWGALSAELKFDLRPDERFTLRDATEGLRLHEPKTLERVQKVCERAMKEYAIEKALNDMEKAWEELEFGLFPYRSTGTSVIKISDEVSERSRRGRRRRSVRLLEAHSTHAVRLWNNMQRSRKIYPSAFLNPHFFFVLIQQGFLNPTRHDSLSTTPCAPQSSSKNESLNPIQSQIP